MVTRNPSPLSPCIGYKIAQQDPARRKQQGSMDMVLYSTVSKSSALLYGMVHEASGALETGPSHSSGGPDTRLHACRRVIHVGG